MTREELREKVAKAMAATHGYKPDALTYREADAAIAIIRGETLEEAAKVALGEYRRSSSGEEIAAAIRAMKEKSDD